MLNSTHDKRQDSGFPLGVSKRVSQESQALSRVQQYATDLDAAYT